MLSKQYISQHSRLVFRVVEYPLAVALNEDVEAGIDELLGGGGCDRCATLKLLLLAAEPEGLLGHGVVGSDGGVVSAGMEHLCSFVGHRRGQNDSASNSAHVTRLD